MVGPWCSYNGTLIPAERALVSIDDIDFSYGYGVYETLKVRHRIIYFPRLHEERLFHSAQRIGLLHPYNPGDITQRIIELVRANRIENSNIRVLLIGGEAVEQARLYIMTLNPLFPDRKEYKQGAHATIYPGERVFPDAKTLNMLVSTLAYRGAKKEGAYDAVFCNRFGQLTEGTRTNLFYIRGDTVYTPPKSQVLEGVTRITLMEALAQGGIPMVEQELPEIAVPLQDGIFLTSTSTKVMPLRQLGPYPLSIPPLIRYIMKLYETYLEAYTSTEEAVF